MTKRYVNKRKLDVNSYYVDKEDKLLWDLIRKKGIVGITKIDANHTVTEGDDLIVANTSGITVTLADFGKTITIKNNTAGNITIDGGDYTIEGSNTITSASTESYTLILVDTEWLVI